MKFTYVIYHMKDAFGKQAAAVAEEGCNDVQICGLRDKAGKEQYFESEAYHLQDWCNEHGIEYRSIQKEETL